MPGCFVMDSRGGCSRWHHMYYSTLDALIVKCPIHFFYSDRHECSYLMLKIRRMVNALARDVSFIYINEMNEISI